MKITKDMKTFAKLIKAFTEIDLPFKVEEDETSYMVIIEGSSEDDDDDTDIIFEFSKGAGQLIGVLVFNS